MRSTFGNSLVVALRCAQTSRSIRGSNCLRTLEGVAWVQFVSLAEYRDAKFGYKVGLLHIYMYVWRKDLGGLALVCGLPRCCMVVRVETVFVLWQVVSEYGLQSRRSTMVSTDRFWRMWYQIEWLDASVQECDEAQLAADAMVSAEKDAEAS